MARYVTMETQAANIRPSFDDYLVRIQMLRLSTIQQILGSMQQNDWFDGNNSSKILQITSDIMYLGHYLG